MSREATVVSNLMALRGSEGVARVTGTGQELGRPDTVPEKP